TSWTATARPSCGRSSDPGSPPRAPARSACAARSTSWSARRPTSSTKETPMPYSTIGRRELLRRGALFVALGLTAPSFVARTAAAAEPSPQGSRTKALVVVQLGGGNDGLNTVVPIGEEAYYKVRPTLAIPRQEALTIADGLALHPSLS